MVDSMLFCFRFVASLTIFLFFSCQFSQVESSSSQKSRKVSALNHARIKIDSEKNDYHSSTDVAESVHGIGSFRKPSKSKNNIRSARNVSVKICKSASATKNAESASVNSSMYCNLTCSAGYSNAGRSKFPSEKLFLRGSVSAKNGMNLCTINLHEKVQNVNLVELRNDLVKFVTFAKRGKGSKIVVKFRIFDRSVGKTSVVWSAMISDSGLSPKVYSFDNSDYLYVVSGSMMYVFDITSGAKVYSSNFKSPIDGIYKNVSSKKNVIFIKTLNNRLYCYTEIKSTGHTFDVNNDISVYKLDRKWMNVEYLNYLTQSQNSLIFQGERLIVSYGKILCCFDEGEDLFVLNLEKFGDIGFDKMKSDYGVHKIFSKMFFTETLSTQLIKDKNVFFAILQNGGVFCFDYNGVLLWSVNVELPCFSGGLFNDLIFITCAKGLLFLNKTNGKIEKIIKNKSVKFAQSINGYLLICDEDGLCLMSEKFVFSRLVSGKISSPRVFANSIFYLKDNLIYVFS